MRPQLRFALVFAATAMAAYVVAGCTGEARFYAEVEAEEPGRNDFEAAGQANCYVEAMTVSPTPRCPLQNTGKPYPSQGILVLDDFYVQPLLPAGVDSTTEYLSTPDRGVDCAEDVQRLSCTAFLTSLFAGTNTARSSRGALPDMILPGAGQFHAAFGYWHNTVNDEYIHVDDTGRQGTATTTGPSNEWVLKPNSLIVSYVEPGTHPSYDSMRRPSAVEPDIHYGVASTTLATTPVVYQQKNGLGSASTTAAILWLDGSLLRTLRVTTVSDAIFGPSDDGTLPFRTTPTSLVDIDAYSAVAAGPVAEIYETTLGPAMNEISSPSYGSCPDNCIPGPVAAGGTPYEAVAGDLQSRVYAKILPETRAGSGNTAAGRGDAFERAFHAHIDVLASTRIWAGAAFVGAAWTPAMQMPLSADPAGSEDPTIPPSGFLSPEVWVGIWRDFSADGFVGAVSDPSDPYESGSRPQPNDYYNSLGEFYGIVPKLKDNILNVTLYPHTNWGPGVYYLMGEDAGDATARSAAECNYPEAAAAARPYLCPAVSAGSTTPILVELGMAKLHSAAGGGGWLGTLMDNPAGHYGRSNALWFATGSPGFTMCTDPIAVKYDVGGETFTEMVRDCDVIAPWTNP